MNRYGSLLTRLVKSYCFYVPTHHVGALVSQCIYPFSRHILNDGIKVNLSES